MENMDYVIMLRESLEKKADILRVLLIRNKEQTAILQDPNSTPDDLEKNMNMKSELIDRIVMLDDGFEQLFVVAHDVLVPQRPHEVQHPEAFVVHVALQPFPDAAAMHVLKPELVHRAVQAEEFLFVHPVRLDVELLQA